MKQTLPVELHDGMMRTTCGTLAGKSLMELFGQIIHMAIPIT